MMTMDNYAAGIKLDADPPGEKCERLRAVVEQARDLCVWFRKYEPYVLSPRARKKLTELEAAANDVLNDGKGDPCPLTTPPKTVASVENRAQTEMADYAATVAAIAQRLSERPEGVQQNSQTTTNEPSPSAELICSCDTGESGCACSKG